MSTVHLLVVLSLCARTLCFFEENFKNEIYDLPKCCPKKHYLQEDFTCAALPVGLYLDSEVTSNFTSNSGLCADVLVLDGTSSIVLANFTSKTYHVPEDLLKYPKCCPADHKYDTKQHKCIKKGKTFHHVYLNIGLHQCASEQYVIVDHTNVTLTNDLSVVTEEGQIFKYGKYCLDECFETGALVVRVCDHSIDVCKLSFETEGIPCYTKCCPDGEVFMDGPRCLPTYDSGIDLDDDRFHNVIDGNFGILYSQLPPMYQATPNHKLLLNRWGEMHVNKYFHWLTYSSKDAFYCIETVKTVNNSSQQFFLYSNINKEDMTVMTVRVHIICSVMSISVLFLLLTLACYVVLPEKHTLYGKTIMMFCVFRISGYSFYVYFQLAYDRHPCYITDFPIQFFLLGAFSWLNVLSFDLWSSVRKMQLRNGSFKKSKKRENLTFLYYNLYGHGFPLFWTLLTYIIWTTDRVPEYLRPRVGEYVCFFDKYPKTYDYFIYFKLPQTLLILINTFLFIKIKSFCFKIKDDIEDLKDNVKLSRVKIFRANKERLSIVFKLTLFAGYTFLFDVLAKATYMNYDLFLAYVAIVWDIFNFGSDTMIFCILVLRRKTMNELRRRFRFLRRCK